MYVCVKFDNVGTNFIININVMDCYMVWYYIIINIIYHVLYK